MYDGFMSDVDYTKWADYLCAIYSARLGQGSKSIIDAACGTGNISLELRARSHDVIGSDISEDMLFAASQKARKRGLKLQFVKQDMRALLFHKKADIINCSCDGVNYLTDETSVRKFFSSAHCTLRKGGLICFDISTQYKMQHILDNRTFAQDDDDAAFIWQNVFDPESKLIHMYLTLFSASLKNSGSGKLFERTREEHVQRAHSPEELALWLEREGFDCIEFFDAFSFEAPQAECERIQFCAQAN